MELRGAVRAKEGVSAKMSLASDTFIARRWYWPGGIGGIVVEAKFVAGSTLNAMLKTSRDKELSGSVWINCKVNGGSVALFDQEMLT